MNRTIFVAAVAFSLGTLTTKAMTAEGVNDVARYRDTGPLRNRRRIVQVNVEEYRRGAKTADEVMQSLEQTCGAHGHVWGEWVAEKLALIGRPATGVAHEITSRSAPLRLRRAGKAHLRPIQHAFGPAGRRADSGRPPAASRLQARCNEIGLDFLKRDIPTLMAESKEGVTRARLIVQNLEVFSRVDTSQEWVQAGLHHGIDSAKNIVNTGSSTGPVADFYGTVPDIKWLPSELNEVFMNLLVNASHAIHDERGPITIRRGRCR